MPISRFGAVLLSQGQFVNYMQLLRDNFSENNLDDVMCRSLISVDWQGYLYDCDFNQMMNLPMQHPDLLASDHRVHISSLMATQMQGAQIRVGEHCYACTAGQGSSCGGALEGRSISIQGIGMTQNIQFRLLTHWVNSKPLHGFSKNPGMPGLRYRSWQGCRPLPAGDASPDKPGFPDNSMPNCGF
jgi:hypothetical protein